MSSSATSLSLSTPGYVRTMMFDIDDGPPTSEQPALWASRKSSTRLISQGKTPMVRSGAKQHRNVDSEYDDLELDGEDEVLKTARTDEKTQKGGRSDGAVIPGQVKYCSLHRLFRKIKQ